ncbi:hypothetical protein SNEBB_007661 [Seison nebaliae]|nr:hypothetical protein SNEBB_007661 [Seison nebaliae]
MKISFILLTIGILAISGTEAFSGFFGEIKHADDTGFNMELASIDDQFGRSDLFAQLDTMSHQESLQTMALEQMLMQQHQQSAPPPPPYPYWS